MKANWSFLDGWQPIWLIDNHDPSRAIQFSSNPLLLISKLAQKDPGEMFVDWPVTGENKIKIKKENKRTAIIEAERIIFCRPLRRRDNFRRREMIPLANAKCLYHEEETTIGQFSSPYREARQTNNGAHMKREQFHFWAP